MTATKKITDCEKCGKYPADIDVDFWSMTRPDEQQTATPTKQTLAICIKCVVKLSRNK